MNKKIHIFFIAVFLTLSVLSQSNPFLSMTYDMVIAYEFQGEGLLLIEECLEKQPNKISKTLELNKNQIEEIETILTSETAYGNSTASCFDPHFSLVYYLEGKVVGTINICLDCNYLISSVEIPSTKKKYIKINEDYSYPAKGFSSATRRKISQLCKVIGFEKFLEPLESIFIEVKINKSI